MANLGSTWLKPPGVGKTLYQLREEEREAAEHAEAMRRELLVQELAEAEAAAAAAAAAREEEGEEGDLMMVEGEDDGEEGGEDGMGMRDLDEDIPDADEGGFGYDGISDDDEEEDEDGDEEEEEEEEGDEEDLEEEGDSAQGNHSISRVEAHQQRRAQQRELADRMANIRATEDRMRQMMARGGQGPHAGGDLYGGEEEDIDAEDQAQVLDEDDFVGGSSYREELVESGMDMDMDANLDDDIPEAESGGYEHTDSEASLSSGDDAHDLSYARSSQVLHRRTSLRRSDGPRSSLDISGFLSRDGSSIMGSSPYVRRANH